MLETGLRFELRGVVRDKMSFDGNDGKAVNLLKVHWLGGSCSFMVDSKATLDTFPEKDAFVAVVGVMDWEKGKAPKLQLERVTELDPKTGKAKAA